MPRTVEPRRPEELLTHVAALRARDDGGRVLLGITGAPGAGKTTVARWLAEALAGSAWIPMDGFHLADSQLRRLGALERKGAVDTFDGHGYLATLRRIRSESRNPVFAPEFDRTLEQPIAAGTVVEPGVRVVVSEGNYLLVDGPPWSEVRAEFDAVWFVDAPDDVRRARLVRRHVEFGKSEEQAAAWVDAVDERNARVIEQTRDRADLVVQVGGLAMPRVG